MRVVEKSIFYEDKEYISASRASQEFGYSADYIGQLCRGGKVLGRLVGRTWYVEKNSLLQHRDMTKRGRVPSSKREAKQIFYTSDHAPLMPTLKKEVRGNRRKMVLNAERAFVLAVVALVFILGSNSLVDNDEELLITEKASLSLATALQASSSLVPYDKLESISLFGLVAGAYENAKHGFENMKAAIDDNLKK